MGYVVSKILVATLLVVIPGTHIGNDGCGVTTQDVRIAEPGGPLVSIGQTDVDTRDCIDKVQT